MMEGIQARYGVMGFTVSTQIWNHRFTIQTLYNTSSSLLRNASPFRYVATSLY